jgi:hypothetical protein
VHITSRPLYLWQLVQHLAEPRAQQVDVDVRLRQQVPHRAALLIEQCRHQVGRLDELVVAPDRQALGICKCLLELAGHFVHSHPKTPPRLIASIYPSGGGYSGEFKSALQIAADADVSARWNGWRR